MTGGVPGVGVAWLPGLGSLPGAVDLSTVGPTGRVARAVTLPEALAASAVIDLLCPGSGWHRIVCQLPTCSTSGRSTP